MRALERKQRCAAHSRDGHWGRHAQEPALPAPTRRRSRWQRRVSRCSRLLVCVPGQHSLLDTGNRETWVSARGQTEDAVMQQQHWTHPGRRWRLPNRHSRGPVLLPNYSGYREGWPWPGCQVTGQSGSMQTGHCNPMPFCWGRTYRRAQAPAGMWTVRGKFPEELVLKQNRKEKKKWAKNGGGRGERAGVGAEKEKGRKRRKRRGRGGEVPLPSGWARALRWPTAAATLTLRGRVPGSREASWVPRAWRTLLQRATDPSSTCSLHRRTTLIIT